MLRMKLMTNILPYHTPTYQFREAICDLLKIKDLERLQDFALPEDLKLHDRRTADDTSLHRRFYDSLPDGRFMLVYEHFIRNFVYTMCGNQPIVYQARPTFRIQFVNNFAVDWHRDSDYNHPVEEMNWWLPVTDAYGENSIWIESRKGRHDYHPERVNYGEVLLFPGGELMHGNKKNESKHTRVSFDFRVIPKNKWRKPDVVLKGLKFGRIFDIGITDEYYYREI